MGTQYKFIMYKEESQSEVPGNYISDQETQHCQCLPPPKGSFLFVLPSQTFLRGDPYRDLQ